LEDLIFYKQKWFWLTCGGPSLVTALYLALVATPRYESEALIKVYSATEDASGASAGAGMGTMASPGSYVFKQYAQGFDCLHALDMDKLKSHWARGDFLEGFGGFASFFSKNDMRLWDYYQSHVGINVDDVSGTVRINVEGYSSEFVRSLNENILRLASAELQQSGNKAYRADIVMLQNKSRTDSEKLALDLHSMEDFQKAHSIANYELAYTSALSTIAQFRQLRLTVMTREAASGFLAERSQQYAAVKTQLSTIDNEISSQKHDISEKMAPYYAEYSRLEAAIREDSSVLLMNEQSLLQAQEMAVRNAYYIDILEKPVLPSNPTEPRIIKWLSIALIGFFFLYKFTK